MATKCSWYRACASAAGANAARSSFCGDSPESTDRAQLKRQTRCQGGASPERTDRARVHSRPNPARPALPPTATADSDDADPNAGPG